MTTTTADQQPETKPTMFEDPDGFEEPEQYALRQKLGLRPVYYSSNTDGTKGLHPDQRGCPSWCWIAQHDEYDHSIDQDRPMTATHTTDNDPTIVASFYKGASHAPDYATHTATLEPRLEQVGQNLPAIHIALRHYPVGNKQVYLHKHLSLRLDDARELALVLNYLVGLAEQG